MSTHCLWLGGEKWRQIQIYKMLFQLLKMESGNCQPEITMQIISYEKYIMKKKKCWYFQNWNENTALVWQSRDKW